MLNFAKWVKQKNTEAKILKDVCNGVTTRWTTKSKLRKKGKGHGYFTKHFLYPQVVCKLKDKNREFHTMCTSPKRATVKASADWLSGYPPLFPELQMTQTHQIFFFLKQLSEDLERKINLWLKCFSSKEQLTGFPWYFHINKD